MPLRRVRRLSNRLRFSLTVFGDHPFCVPQNVIDYFPGYVLQHIARRGAFLRFFCISVSLGFETNSR